MGKGVRLVVATALVVVFAGLGAWWVLNEASEGAATSSAPTVAPRKDAPAALPVLPQPVTGGDTADSAPERLTAQPEAAPTPAPAELGVPVRFTGRIVDGGGQPVQGATVRVLPSGRLLKLLGLRLGPFEPALDLARFAQTTSAADGSFAFDARDVPAEQASLAEHPTGYTSFEGLWPELLVSHPAFEATARACIGWSGSAFAAGDVVLGPGASVTGRAVDEDGRPLADVLVGPPPLYDRWEGTPGNLWPHARLLLVAHSAADGTFRLDGLWPGKMSISLEAKGRTAPVQELVLTAGEVRDLGDVQLARGGTIEGWVIEASSGRPVPDARVLVRPPFDSLFKGEDPVAQAFASKVGSNDVMVDHETHANEQGAFSVTGLDPATPAWDVFAGGPGYEPAKQSGIVADGAAVSLALQRAGLIVLTVLDPDTQEPIVDATIVARRYASDDEYSYTKLEVISDPQALAALEVPPPHAGVYALAPAGSHRNEAIVSAPGRATRGFQLPEVVAPERASRTIHLGREAVCSGRVVDAEGAPIADAKLTLHAPEDLRVRLPDREARADAAGRFRFDALLDGDWDLSASAPRFVTSEPRRVALRKGAAPVEEEIVLQPAGAIAGVVTAGGAPLPSVEVHVVSVKAKAEPQQAQSMATGHGSITYKAPPRPPSWKALTDAAGRFLIESLPPDEYELTGPPAVTQTVGVASGKTTEVTLLARKRPRLHGHVYDERGPVVGAEVRADWPMSGGPDGFTDEAQTMSGADGSWELELWQPGAVAVSAVSDDASTSVTDMTVDWDEDATVELRFSTGVIAGSIVDGAGAPVAAARASLYRVITNENGSISNKGGRQAKADERGHFEFDRIVAGRYMVRADAPGYVRAESASFEVADGEHAAPLSIVLQRAGIVRGIVKASVPGGAVPQPLSARFKGAAGPGASTKIGADGRFSYDRLAPGTWTCEIYSPQESSKEPPFATCEVQVVAGQAVDVSLQLP